MSARLVRAQGRTSTVDSALHTHALPAVQTWDDGGSTAQTIAFARTRMRDTLSAYERAEAIVNRETSEDDGARNVRDAAEEALRVMLSDGKTMTSVVYGPDTLAKLQLDTVAGARTPGAAVLAAERVVAAIRRTPDMVPINAVASFDLGAYADQLATLAEQLNAHLDALRVEERETQQARADRDRAHAEWQAALTFAAGLGRLVLNHAGEPGLAERIFGRRAARRSPSPAPEPPNAPANTP